jgi:hypothetical protein
MDDHQQHLGHPHDVPPQDALAEEEAHEARMLKHRQQKDSDISRGRPVGMGHPL